jgi:hypothetical protein
MIVEPCHPFQRCQLHRFTALPGRAAMNQFRFVQAIDGLGQSIVIAISLAPHRGFDAGLGKALAVPNRYVLRAPVGVMN